MCVFIFLSTELQRAALSPWHAYAGLKWTTVTNLSIFQYSLKAWALAWQVPTLPRSQMEPPEMCPRKNSLLSNWGMNILSSVNLEGIFFINFSKA